MIVGHTRRIPWFPLIFGLLAFVSVGYVVIVHMILISRAPAGTSFNFVSGHIGDFYAYSYMIKSGREGHLLYREPYVDVTLPSAPIHPFYHVLGFLTRPFNASPFFIYFTSRIVMLLVLFGAVFVLIAKTTRSTTTRLVATALFFSSTDLYHVVSLSTWTIARVEVYSDYFNAFSKLFAVPPHHLAAITVFIAILLLAQAKRTLGRSIAAGVLILLLGFLHPYVLLVMTGLFAFHAFVHVFSTRSFDEDVRYWLYFFAIGAIALIANWYMFNVFFAFPFAESTITWEPSTVGFVDYLRALGPLVFLAPLVFLDRRSIGKSVVGFLVLWSILPLFLFVLYNLGFPFSIFRLFQSYQQIPLAILTAIGLVRIGTMLRVRIVLVVTVTAALFLYGAFAYGAMTHVNIEWVSPNYFNIYIPDYLVVMFRVLDRVPADSIVLGGQYVSNMAPVFAHVKAPLGHDSANVHFARELSDAQDFYNGNDSSETARTFLDKYHIAYVIFGIDAPPFSSLASPVRRLFEEIYHDGGISIAKVVD